MLLSTHLLAYTSRGDIDDTHEGWHEQRVVDYLQISEKIFHLKAVGVKSYRPMVNETCIPPFARRIYVLLVLCWVCPPFAMLTLLPETVH